ncbi:MAG: hypothetical protein QM518_11080 [Verrucomicrobiota bacterium]|nr:hypothetical protein [Verrucomicrobiota bacterium]
MKTTLRWWPQSVLCIALMGALVTEPTAESVADRPPEAVVQGELIAFPGPWSFMGRPSLILVSDEELEALAADPDRVLNLSTSLQPDHKSLRQVCERAAARGQRTLILAFDHFFAQYRPGQDHPRRLMPDMPEYIDCIARISEFAQGFGLGLEISLLSPLEIGPAFEKATGESGVWMHYRIGLRDPGSGAYSVQLWRQHRWTNNKGPIEIEPAQVRVFAFRSHRVPGTRYRAVDPNAIVEITGTAEIEEWPGVTTPNAQRIRVHGAGMTEIGELDRVMVVQTYRSPEMDYFSARALPFMQELVDRYADAGVELNGLYADEMHIQQDWRYFNHHDHGAFALRYVSDGFAREFSRRYGAEYGDFAKYLLYFAHGQEDFSPELDAKADVMYVLGADSAGVQKTALLRSRYYRLLQNGVVDLFVAAKHYAERKMGRRLEARAHATWAESPTIDYWAVGGEHLPPHQYEYTSNFVWSCTVHQAASACHDYFKWGDFLTGNGNDHAEGGWLDRNYFGLALGCSTGVLNEIPYSYAAHWGMPHPIWLRRTVVQSAFGAAGSPLWGAVQDMEHRDVEVLMLYPLDLVAADERFGSWMTQYGYANYITQEKLLERGAVRDGAVWVAGRRFTTLVALFEPFPEPALLGMMAALVQAGGRVVWSGPPPLLDAEGGDAFGSWKGVFGISSSSAPIDGRMVPGRMVAFEGSLEGVAEQVILTDLFVDRVYPVEPGMAAPIARVEGAVVGTHLTAEGGGQALYLGYRPRDDQSASLGYETSNWFGVLDRVGAYPDSGRFEGVRDNTEVISRTTDYLACRFPNGAIAIARHLKAMREDWPGGFARDAEADAAWAEAHALPSDALILDDFKVAGHRVSYSGKHGFVFRADPELGLIAFAGFSPERIAVDGREYTISDRPLSQVAWAPVPEKRRVAGGAVLQVQLHGSGLIRIPRAGLPQGLRFFAEGAKPGDRGEPIEAALVEDTYELHVPPTASGRWIYGCP